MEAQLEEDVNDYENPTPVLDAIITVLVILAAVTLLVVVFTEPDQPPDACELDHEAYHRLYDR